MTELKGVDSLKKEIDLGVTLVSIVSQAKKDGKVDAADMALLLQLVPVMGPAAEGLSEVMPELKDLSTSEAAELVAYVMAKLSLGDAKATKIVEKALKFAVAAYELEQAIVKKD